MSLDLQDGRQAPTGATAVKPVTAEDRETSAGVTAGELSGWDRREMGLRAAAIHDRLAEAARELRLLQARVPGTSLLDDVELTLEQAIGSIVACRRELDGARASAHRR